MRRPGIRCAPRLWQQWAGETSPGRLERDRDRCAQPRALVGEARQEAPQTTNGQSISLPTGWVPISADDSAVFETELAAEVAADLKPRHRLAKRSLTALAHCDRRDHVLFETAEDPKRWALVHLSWSAQPEPDIRPHCELFASPETAAAGLRAGVSGAPGPAIGRPCGYGA